jgi:hypothetical protein
MAQVGQLWRAAASGSLYRVEEIDLAALDPFERVKLRLVEPGPGMINDWCADAEHRLRELRTTDFDPPSLKDLSSSRLMGVELAWFAHGAARLELGVA